VSASVLVHGAERLAVRTAEQLRLLDVDAVALGDLDVTALEQRLGRGDAQALVLCDEDDIANFHLALAAREAQPDLRLVVRLFNLELGAQAERLLGCRALSASQLAAPAFVEAALRDDYSQRLQVEGHELLVLPGGDRDPLLALESGDGLLPDSAQGALSVIGQPRSRGAIAARRRRRGQVATVMRVLLADRRLRLLAAVLVALIALTAILYASVEDIGASEALHRSVAAVLGSDELSESAPGWLEIYDIGVLLVGVAALALVIALLTDALVSTRLAHALGGLPRRLRGHAIVCGLGTVGYRIGNELLSEGIDVCGVDIGDDLRLTRARSAGIAAAAGDASQISTLRSLGVHEAAYLFCVTDNDVANLEAALVARAENPGLRIVLRLFDPDLAARVERVAGLGVSRSVSDLAAPAFAAAALGRDVTGAIRTPRGLLLVARVSALDATVSEIASSALRVLSRERDGKLTWAPSGGERLEPGDRVTVIGTQRGLAQLSGDFGGTSPS
jgi:Trk K+ transport system NAD-binding subunit